MAVVETVKIVSKDSEQGYMIINKSDFTKGQALFEEKKETPVVKKETKKNE